MDRRRAIIALACLGAVAGSCNNTFAQQVAKVWRIGFLIARSRSSIQKSGYDAIFVKSLRELGYVEGKNIVIEWRFAAGQYDRLPGMAVELVRLNPDVMLAWAPPGVQAAKQATSTIPIVMLGVGDPVGSGFVASLARPGGNITGISNLTIQLSTKFLELLHAVIPKLARVALLANPKNPSFPSFLKSVQASAAKSAVSLIPVEASTESQIDAAFGTMTRERAGALMIHPDAFFVSQVQQIAERALKHRLPSIYGAREYAKAGGLMTYGQNLSEHFRRAAVYVDKILKGAKTSELSVEQPTKFELVLNLKTAKRLGLTISRDFLALVDEVIE